MLIPLLALAAWPAIIEVRPSETGVPPTVNDAKHVIALPVNPRRAPTVLMLPATHWQPGSYKTFATTLSRRGFRVIVLSYPNLQVVDQLCRADPDPDSHGKLRREVLYGQND